MSDLVEFLKQRLAEDEATAKASVDVWTSLGDGYGWEYTVQAVRYVCDEDAEHIARHDPARVLAEVAAKRAVVEMHVPVHPDVTPTCQHVPRCEDETSWVCPGCDTWDDDLPCPTLRHLAAVYSGHDDYREEEWAP